MKGLPVVIASLFLAGAALAQQAPNPTASPTAQDLENQIAEVGCKAERTAAANTIVNLQQQIRQLQQQLDAKKGKKP